MSQKVSARRIISIVQNLNGIPSFEQKISVSFTPDEMFVRYIGLGSGTLNALSIKSTLHADPLGSVVTGCAGSPNTGFKMGYDVTNTHTFKIYDVAVNTNSMVNAATYLGLTLEFVQYEKK